MSTLPFRQWRFRRKVLRSDERRRLKRPNQGTQKPRMRSRSESHMKGGITEHGEESQGREEEGRQEAVS